MPLKFISFSFDEEAGWTLHAEGLFPNDLYTLQGKISNIGKAYFPYQAPEDRKARREPYQTRQPEAACPAPDAETCEMPEAKAEVETESYLCAVTPDGQIYRIAETVNDPTAKGKGYSIFWVDPDTGGLSRCKGKGFTGWPERTLSSAEDRFRDWAGDMGYEVREAKR